MSTGHDPSDARLASDGHGGSAQSRAVQAYLLIAESSKVDAKSRLSAAEKIIPLDRLAAARAFHAIAGSPGLNAKSRMSAAEKIVPLDSQLAVQALSAIAGAPRVSIALRITAAGLMVSLDSSEAAAILKKLATESLRSGSGSAGQITGERFSAILSAVDNLAEFDRPAAIEILYDLAAAPIGSSYRLSAADRIAKLEAKQNTPPRTAPLAPSSRQRSGWPPTLRSG